MKYFVYCRKSSEAEDRQIQSIDSQEAELLKAFARQPEIHIIDVLKEAFSARKPGRPVFDQMLSRIEAGEAEGIIAWHPDRLARNSMDGGRLIYSLDQGSLKDLKFSTLSFENTSTGKFMLSIMFGQSKYYVDNLSENVKRGNRAKISQGWRPNHPPIGYLNDPVGKTIVKDPARFQLVRRLFNLALTGGYSIRRLAEESRRLGLKTLKRKRTGGQYLSAGNIHFMLTNPFYAGVLRWAGNNYKGAHEAMVTRAELAQLGYRLSSRLDKLPPRKQISFPFKGLIRCGKCGQSVTAENKVNRYGHRYTYYHCTKTRVNSTCAERSIRSTNLHDDYLRFIREHTVPRQLCAWVLDQIQRERNDSGADREAREKMLRDTLSQTDKATDNLTSLRVRELISDEAFLRKRAEILEEQAETRETLARIERGDEWFEPARSVFSFNDRAVFWYSLGDNEIKWQITKVMSSNLVLKDKKVSIEAADPFVRMTKMASCPMLLAALDRIRNLYNAGDKEFLQRLSLIKQISERFREQNDFPYAA